ANIQSDLAEVFTVGGPGGTSLADIGITTGADGKLALNTATLQEKLTSDPDSVTNILALTATSTDADVRLISAGSKTSLSGAAFAVNITQAASQARVTGGVEQMSALQ